MTINTSSSFPDAAIGEFLRIFTLTTSVPVAENIETEASVSIQTFSFIKFSTIKTLIPSSAANILTALRESTSTVIYFF